MEKQKKLEKPLNDTLLVGFDFTHGKDQDIVIVGIRKGGITEILNAFQGEDARALYDLLVTKS